MEVFVFWWDSVLQRIKPYKMQVFAPLSYCITPVYTYYKTTIALLHVFFSLKNILLIHHWPCCVLRIQIQPHPNDQMVTIVRYTKVIHFLCGESQISEHCHCYTQLLCHHIIYSLRMIQKCKEIKVQTKKFLRLLHRLVDTDGIVNVVTVKNITIMGLFFSVYKYSYIKNTVVSYNEFFPKYRLLCNNLDKSPWNNMYSS